MSSSGDPRARPEAEARLLRLTDEIDQLRIDLGRKIDEAADLMGRIMSLDATSSQDGHGGASQDSLEIHYDEHRGAPPIVP